MGRKMGFIRNEGAASRGRRCVVPLDYRHACCEGPTGSGKTASVILPTLEDRIKRGHTILFFSYKGHEHRQVKRIAAKYGRLEDVREFGKPHGESVNLLAGMSEEEARQAIYVMAGGGEQARDPYWPHSAANFGQGILAITRKLHRIKALAGEMDDPGKILQAFSEPLPLQFPEGSGEDGGERRSRGRMSKVYDELPLDEPPSFALVHRIAAAPSLFNEFFAGLEGIVDRLEEARELLISAPGTAKEEEAKRHFLVELLRLMEELPRWKALEVDESGASATGNNGVRQVLENALSSTASRHYLNEGRNRLLEEGEIMVVDIEGIDEALLPLLMQSVLSRLAVRMRGGSDLRPVSVFIDEANRVLPGDSDLYGDVLREAKTELIVAYQNESQMEAKFGEVRWAAVRENFLHEYRMEASWMVRYRFEWTEEVYRPLPVTFEVEELDEAEEAYNSLERNLEAITGRFVVYGEIPERFLVHYDPRGYADTRSISLVDRVGGTRTEAEYIGARAMKQYRDWTDSRPSDERIDLTEEPSMEPFFGGSIDTPEEWDPDEMEFYEETRVPIPFDSEGLYGFEEPYYGDPEYDYLKYRERARGDGGGLLDGKKAEEAAPKRPCASKLLDRAILWLAEFGKVTGSDGPYAFSFQEFCKERSRLGLPGSCEYVDHAAFVNFLSDLNAAEEVSWKKALKDFASVMKRAYAEWREENGGLLAELEDGAAAVRMPDKGTLDLSDPAEMEWVAREFSGMSSMRSLGLKRLKGASEEWERLLRFSFADFLAFCEAKGIPADGRRHRAHAGYHLFLAEQYSAYPESPCPYIDWRIAVDVFLTEYKAGRKHPIL